MSGKITYQILTDRTSELYKECVSELSEGSANHIFNKKMFSMDDFYMEKCFDKISAKLHKIPGAVDDHVANLNLPDAYISIHMTLDNLFIDLRKEKIAQTGEPLLFIDFIPDSREPEPFYLDEIVNDYKAKKI